MNVASLQRDFRSWLVGARDETASRFGSNARAGLSVYQNNYRAQLVGCLENAFPQLRAWIGDDAFLHAAVRHIDTHPPHAWTLDAYPDEFGKTLAALFPHNPDIHELAWIETALGTAFVAPDARALSAAELADVDWETARLQFTPTLLTAPASTNAADIWRAMREQRPRPEGQMLAEPGRLVVWRRGFASFLGSVDTLEYEALAHVQGDGSFATLCGVLIDRLGESAGVSKAGALLAGWIGSELITGVSHAPSPIPPSDQDL